MDDVENENYLGGQLYINEQRQRYLEQNPHLEEEGDDIISKLAQEFYTLSKQEQSEYTLRAKSIRNHGTENATQKNNGNDTHRMAEELERFDNNAISSMSLIRDNIKDHITCSICLDVLKKTAVVTRCLHRFCKECIESALHKCNNECPECRVHVAATRSLRYDHTFDEIVHQVMGDIDMDHFENDPEQRPPKDGWDNGAHGRKQHSSGDDVSALQVSLKSYFQCILCDEMMTNVTTIPDCLHKFCEKCIHSRITTNSSCPYCESNVQKSALRRDIKYDKIQEVIFHPKAVKENSIADTVVCNSTGVSSTIYGKNSETSTERFGQGYIGGVRNRKTPDKFAPLLNSTSLAKSRKRSLERHGNNSLPSRVAKVSKTSGAPSHILFSKQEVQNQSGPHQEQRRKRINQTDTQSIWDERVRALKAFKSKHGDRPLPEGTLRNWSTQVRRDLSQIDEDDPDSYPKNITPERIRELVEAGFPFIPPQIFSKRLKSLTEFKHRFQHCNVSEDYADDPDLAEWCAKVRASFNCDDKSKLASHRLMDSQVIELEKLGFDFSGGNISSNNHNYRSEQNDENRQDLRFSTKAWCSQVRQEVQMIAASINDAFKENEKVSSKPSVSEEELKMKIRLLSAENKSLHEKVEKCSKEKESDEIIKKQMESQLDSLTHENTSLKKRIQDLIAEKNSLSQNDKFERKNQFLLATLKQLHEDKMLLKKQYEEQITKLSEKHQEEKQATENELKKEKMLCTKQQKLIERLRARVLSLKRDEGPDQNTMPPR